MAVGSGPLGATAWHLLAPDAGIPGRSENGGSSKDREESVMMADGIMANLDKKLQELGVDRFWDISNIGKGSESTMRDKMMALPPLGRVRCLQAFQAKLEAVHTPGDHERLVPGLVAAASSL